ncbi:dienelactone hydrolase family protein [Micromonospora sp. CPCC 206061]|uniref:dienelactone hydrolase family protein n=1 Tax=Micromonospora sp. CPCC 206061 TaxID=3122410 RepID=UPI002FEEEEB3
MDALTDVAVPVDGGLLAATLALPAPARGMVVFAHGSGSSRHSPRNQAVARYLHQGGYGTVLLDLLTEREERLDQATAELRFDIGLLGDRLVATLDWLPTQPDVAGLPVGLFGASTGAAAALVAAARRRDVARAVVSRGGRPDLAANALDSVRAPTLLIVGGEDHRVIELNKQAAALLGSLAQTVIVPGASHLFTEAGALEQVSAHARDWFDRHLQV